MVQGFWATQGISSGVHLFCALFSYATAFIICNEVRGSGKNRAIMIAVTVLHFVGPVLMWAIWRSPSFNRGLSDETGLRLLEEAALWSITSFCVIRPFTQLLRVLLVRWRVGICTKACGIKIEWSGVWYEAVVHAMSEGQGGLFDLEWLHNWREAKGLCMELCQKLEKGSVHISIGEMRVWRRGKDVERVDWTDKLADLVERPGPRTDIEKQSA